MEFNELLQTLRRVRSSPTAADLRTLLDGARRLHGNILAAVVSDSATVSDLLRDPGAYAEHRQRLRECGVAVTSGRRGRTASAISSSCQAFFGVDLVKQRLLADTLWRNLQDDLFRKLMLYLPTADWVRSESLGPRRWGILIPLATINAAERQPPPYKTNEGRGVDPGIEREVRVLFDGGVDTTESCQGGQGHPFPEPTVRFSGGDGEGRRAFLIATRGGLKVTELRRVWVVQAGELEQPQWEMVFHHPHGSSARAVEQPDGTVVFEWPGRDAVS